MWTAGLVFFIVLTNFRKAGWVLVAGDMELVYSNHGNMGCTCFSLSLSLSLVFLSFILRIHAG